MPAFGLLHRRIGSEQRYVLDDYEAHAIGAWLPEFEFTHYIASAAWKRLMDNCCAYLTVSGSSLASLPYIQTGRPFVSWIASGWSADRKDRIQQFSLGRRLVDRTIVRPIVGRLERAILRSGSVLALSSYTRCVLDKIAGQPVVRNVLPSPISTDFFTPKPDTRISRRIGFSGRLSDPRKNLELLFVALSHLRQSGHEVNALLIGAEPGTRLRQRAQDLGIGDSVDFCPHVSVDTLRDKLRTLDLFVVPSHQEGLCISALEAMACGCPVVSTRCGGPEEFVLNDETGFVVGHDPTEMADTILRILKDSGLRRRLGEAAREKVVQDYSLSKAKAIFWQAFEEQFVSPGAAA